MPSLTREYDHLFKAGGIIYYCRWMSWKPKMRHLTNKLTKIVIPCVILYGLISCGMNDESSLIRILFPTQLSSPQTEKKPTGLANIGG